MSACRCKAARTPEEDARLKALDASIEKETADLLAFFDTTIYSGAGAESDAAQADGASGNDNSAQSYLQETLAKLGPHVLGIRLLLGESHAYEIVVTANSRKKIRAEGHPGRAAQQGV